MKMRKALIDGTHTITIPLHREVARGTFQDILIKVARVNGLSREDILQLF